MEFLHSIGLLSERYIGCHGCILDEDDVTLKEEKAKPRPCARLQSEALRGQGLPQSLVKTKGIPYCFGTDGCASNNHLDIMETMKFASLLAKFFSHDPTMLPARETFDPATKTAAEIFFLGTWEIRSAMAPILSS